MAFMSSLCASPSTSYYPGPTLLAAVFTLKSPGNGFSLINAIIHDSKRVREGKKLFDLNLFLFQT